MTVSEVKNKIESSIPGSQATVQDLTGTSDHFQVTIISSAFEGKPMIEQHRLVKAIFREDIESGVVHAFSLKTFTPQEWERKGNKP